MNILQNPHLGTGLTHPALADVPFPSTDAQAPKTLLARCPAAGVTPLRSVPSLADALGVAEVWVKDERDRMGLGSFKALGAAYVIACDAENGVARGTTYVTASAGNHGLSVAAGAAAFGARSVIYLAYTVPEAFAERLRATGAEVVRAGDDYEASMEAAMQAADDMGAVLLSDSSWAGYMARPHRLMEGYLALMAEVFDRVSAPTHLFLQAGVGGLAGAAAAIARQHWGAGPRIIVVEPEVAPALIASIRAAGPVQTQGPVSAMGRLDCKVPSLIALKGLARDANDFITITEAEGQAGADLAHGHDLSSTPSGAAGLAGALAGGAQLGLSAQSRVLFILSEGPEA
ncbi:pyridoxal-phosphate dependent enzyme [uncultured Tateyamaria sp.]|uniref:pyridoxal-phosphate dependent enzyme n=1 Tax=uncultured Tateyamaria sp. TaxID=455651 RepID=UPI00260AAA21|nr:pyridoxal-phosphate dependent enzyme [uncultured Tateyamaria sp.]